MGGGSSKAPCTITDSPSSSGLKCILSAPLDELIKPEQFWELYEKQARAGFGSGAAAKQAGMTVNSHETKDVEDGWFEVADTLQGPQGAEMKVLARHKFDKDKKEWTSKMFRAKFEDGDVTETITVKELSSPFRIEAWLDTAGRHEAGPEEAFVLQALLSKILKRLDLEALPAMKDGVDGSDGRLVVLTEALDASIEADKLWAQWLAVLKDGIGKPGLAEHTVKEVDANTFVLVDKFENGFISYEKFTLDPAKDLFVGEVYEMDESMPESSHTMTWIGHLLRDPLRVEFSRDFAPGRKAPSQILPAIQSGVDGCIAEAESAGSWFG